MKLRHVAGAVVGGVSLAAAANRLLARRADDLEPPLAGETDTYRWRGFDVGYTEAGDPEDPDLVLLHGVSAAGSSREFAGVFDALAADYHVVAPDLPGFGRSDRPPLMYSGSLYTTFVEDFLADVTDDPTVVAAGHAGGYAAVAAQEATVEELVLVCPTGEAMPGRRVWLRSLIRTPVVGQALFNLATSKRAIRYFNADHGYHDPEKVTDDLVEYQWQSAHQPGARFAPASFFGGFLDVDVDLGETLASLDAPVTLVWGRQASVAPLADGRRLAERGNGRLVVFDESDIQPHVEYPDQFVQQVMHGEPAQPATEIEIEGVDENDVDATAEDS